MRRYPLSPSLFVPRSAFQQVMMRHAVFVLVAPPLNSHSYSQALRRLVSSSSWPLSFALSLSLLRDPLKPQPSPLSHLTLTSIFTCCALLYSRTHCRHYTNHTVPWSVDCIPPQFCFPPPQNSQASESHCRYLFPSPVDDTLRPAPLSLL